MHSVGLVHLHSECLPVGHACQILTELQSCTKVLAKQAVLLQFEDAHRI